MMYFRENGYAGRRFLAFTLVAMLCAVGAVAGEAGWSTSAAVHKVESTAQARYLVRINVDEAHTCKSKNTYYQDYTASGARFMYEALLMAMASDLPVQVYTTGRCELNGYAEIGAVRVLR